jgi:hypothetical protein
MTAAADDEPIPLNGRDPLAAQLAHITGILARVDSEHERTREALRDLRAIVQDSATTTRATARAVEELKTAIGEDPIDSEDLPGSGLRRSMALLMQDYRQRRGAVAMGVVGGSTIGAAIGQLLQVVLAHWT